MISCFREGTGKELTETTNTGGISVGANLVKPRSVLCNETYFRPFKIEEEKYFMDGMDAQVTVVFAAAVTLHLEGKAEDQKAKQMKLLNLCRAP
jgi:hypothetical protein